METFLIQIYNEEISSILSFLTDNTNLLITSTDAMVIDAVVEGIRIHYCDLNWEWEVVETKKNIEKNTIVIIKLDGTTGMTTNSLLYYYLELANSQKCKVIFVTQISSAIDSMEKRVKSRFSNHVCILRPLKHEEYLALYKYLVYTDEQHIEYIKSIPSMDNSMECSSQESERAKPQISAEETANENLDDKLFLELFDFNLNKCPTEEKPAKKRFEKRKAAYQEIENIQKKGSKKLKLIDEESSEEEINKLTEEEIRNLLEGTELEDSDFSLKMLTEDKIMEVSNLYDLNRDSLQLSNLYHRLKFGFGEFKLVSFLDILDNIHLAILLMCNIEKITFKNVATEFKKFVVNCKELKKCTKDEVFCAFSDISEYKLINERGNLLINETCLRKFINSSHRPHFLRSLLNKLKL